MKVSCGMFFSGVVLGLFISTQVSAVALGALSDGSIDQQIEDCYDNAGGAAALGLPFNNGGGANVHAWGEGFVQDFSNGTSASYCMQRSPGAKAFLVSGGIRDAYRATKDSHGYYGGIGPLGYPLANALTDASGTPVRQLFENGHIDLENGVYVAHLNSENSGWTQIYPSGDTRTVYVSSSQGKDANTGLDANHPVKTLARGMALVRNGYPDHLLLKRGDVWNDEYIQTRNSGRKLQEPFLISYYGSMSADRPLIKTKDLGINFVGNAHDVAIIGIHLKGVSYMISYNPNPTTGGAPFHNPGFGIRWISPGPNLLIEDCMIEDFIDNLDIEGGGEILKGFTLRRNVIVDAFNQGGWTLAGRAQGIFLAYADSSLIEENVFDHNGWLDKTWGSIPNMFSHNLYISDHGATHTIVRGNIVANAAATGMQVRNGGIVENNLVVKNTQSIFMFGHGGEIAYNAVLEGKNMMPNEKEGNAAWGIMILPSTVNGKNPPLFPDFSMSVHDNVTSVSEAYMLNWSIAWGYRSDEIPRLTYKNNPIYKWPGIVKDWTRLPEPAPVNYSDPNRSVEEYNQRYGSGIPTLDAFLAEARKQSRTNWRPEYTAAAVVKYIRAGFVPR